VVQLEGLFTGPPLAPAEVLKGLQSSAPSGEADTPPAASITEGELDIALRILPDAHGEAERCRIEVAVQRESSFGDYGGIEVSLAHAAGEQTETTDELGRAWFDGVPRDESTPLVLMVRLP
jgi:hypothetical protein